ncbi:MAG: AAA family ATPase [Cyclobacteriaceae bacterium]
MKILIFGASGSGTTTLASEIEKRTDFKHIDVDNYYWKKTEPPYQEKIELQKRNKNLKADFESFEKVVVSGSLLNWGKEWQTSFDLVIFIRLANDLRMERLKNRERERYGNRLDTDENLQRNSQAFLEWANKYEDPNFNGRSLRSHKNWLELLNCNTLTVDGEAELNDKTNRVLNEIKKFSKDSSIK